MLHLYFLVLCLALAPSPTIAGNEEQPVIVIVHGAWGGGWAFRDTERHPRPKDVPHPTRSYEQSIRLSGAGDFIPASYILSSDHNPQWSNVGGLAEMLDMISRQSE